MKEKKKNKVKIILLILCLIVSSLFITLGGVATYFYNKYDLDVNKLTQLNNGIKVYSSNMSENTLYNTNRSIVEIDTLPKYVAKAFVDTEDKRFYSHNGYDFKRIVKASLVNFTTKSKSQGASTISQQLVKNTLLSTEKTYSRKIKEVVLAMKMEKKFTKDEILEMYLNTIYFGSNAYGIENASKTYFNKSAKDLTLNEVCCLAGLIKSPNYYSPVKNMENSIKRRNLVAKNMLNAKDISKEDYEKVVNSPIEVCKNEDYDYSYEKEAIYEACGLLNITERELINGNYQIVTFKDDELQKQVIDANNNIINAAKEKTAAPDSLSILLSNDGQVKAYYANSDYNLHNLIRQPASTLKPIAVYLPCIIHNILSPSTPILDEQIDFNGYSPKNADGKFNGYVSARYALSNSLNVPSVKALDYVGLTKSSEVLTSLGINLAKADYNLSLALGSMKNGVKLTDLLSAYSTIANLGTNKGLCFVDKILDENGNVVYKHADFEEKILNDADCFLLTDMLKDCAKNGTAKRLSDLNLPVASKTGTVYNGQNNTDLYNICYTTEHSLLTWVGNIKDNVLPNNMYSSLEPTTINKQILAELYKSHKPNDFAIPDGVARLPYDINEYNDNHIIVAPASNLERYIAYDYFKTVNPPKENLKNQLDFNVEMDRSGAKISFNASKSQTYTLIKKTSKGDSVLNEYSEKSGKICCVDNNIFSFDEITYVLKTENEQKEIKIRPKDYLINLLNNEIVTNKKKWYV